MGRATRGDPLQPGLHQLGAQQRSLGLGLFAMHHQPGQLKLQPPKTQPNTLQLHPSAGRPLHLRDDKLPRPLLELGGVQVPRHAHRSEQQHQRQRAQPAHNPPAPPRRGTPSRLPGRGCRCPSSLAPFRILPALALRSSSAYRAYRLRPTRSAPGSAPSNSPATFPSRESSLLTSSCRISRLPTPAARESVRALPPAEPAYWCSMLHFLA